MRTIEAENSRGSALNINGDDNMHLAAWIGHNTLRHNDSMNKRFCVSSNRVDAPKCKLSALLGAREAADHAPLFRRDVAARLASSEMVRALRNLRGHQQGLAEWSEHCKLCGRTNPEGSMPSSPTKSMPGSLKAPTPAYSA